MDEAKRFDGRALGEQLAKYPLLFAKAALFGQRPLANRATKLNTATVTLVDLGRGPLAVTCNHVLDAYRAIREDLDNVLFQLGHVELDPIAQLVDANAQLDLAAIKLTEKQVQAITAEGEIGSCIFKPKAWPSPSPRKGEFISFGGFPGVLRTIISFDELEIKSWSCGGSEISSVSDQRIVSAFERDKWEKSFGAEHHMKLAALGGMSGGPAFVDRTLYWDFVGVVSDYQENYDAIFFTALSALHADGTIELPPA